MSKYIPGNQKHLTLEDRIYIENSLIKAVPSKIWLNTCAKIRLPSLKKSRLIVCRTGIIKVLFTMQKTSASIAIIAKSPMSVGRFSSAVSNALPALPVTRPAPILSGNAAADLIKPLMSAMVATRKSITILSHTNINTMPGLLTGSTVKNSAIPVPELT